MDLLKFISKKEAGRKGYNAIYEGAGVSADLTKMTLNEVYNLQNRIKKSGSTAVGAYQFINKTLKATASKLGLTGEERFTPELQDRLAMTLLEGRGLKKFLSGKLTEDQFADNLAKEWAALPTAGNKSFYDGVQGNKSLVGRKQVLTMLRSMKGK
jgi:conjugal transfer mating pair stabilization protein TraG